MSKSGIVPRLRPIVAFAALALGCGRGERAHEDAVARAAAELRAADDLAASRRVAELARGGCGDLSRALAALAASQISGPRLGALAQDAVRAAAERCPPARAIDAARGDSAAHAVARSFAHESLGQPAEALAALEAAGGAAPPAAPDEPSRRDLLGVAAAAAAGRTADVARLIGAAPLPDRPELSRRATTALPPRAMGELAALPEVDVELLAAAADRVAAGGGEAAALELRERAAAAAPDRAEAADALARALLAAGRPADAAAAWDRAAAAAPAQPTYRNAALRALVAAGRALEARTRAAREASAARATRDADRLAQASAAAAAAADPRAAVELARAARAARPGDGSLAFLVGERLAEARDVPGAAAAWAELLVCGAHGRAWHRHEISGRLARLAAPGDAAAVRAITAALRAPRTCETVEPDDLAPYLDGVAKQLSAPIPP